MAPERLLKQLRLLAAERGTSMADLIPEALQDKVDAQRPRTRSIGVGAAGHWDTSELAALDRRHFGLLRPRHVRALQLLAELI